jgi:DNA-binding Lrp family transcriptional regulator
MLFVADLGKLIRALISRVFVASFLYIGLISQREQFFATIQLYLLLSQLLGMTFAFVFVECAKDLAASAERASKQVQGVLETHSVKGNSSFDLVVKVQTEDDKKFKEAILALKRIAGIIAVVTSIVYVGPQ